MYERSSSSTRTLRMSFAARQVSEQRRNEKSRSNAPRLDHDGAFGALRRVDHEPHIRHSASFALVLESALPHHPPIRRPLLDSRQGELNCKPLDLGSVRMLHRACHDPAVDDVQVAGTTTGTSSASRSPNSTRIRVTTPTRNGAGLDAFRPLRLTLPRSPIRVSCRLTCSTSLSMSTTSTLCTRELTGRGAEIWRRWTRPATAVGSSAFAILTVTSLAFGKPLE